MDYSNIKSHFKIKADHGNKAEAICPCHNDKEASLSIDYDDKESKTLIYCHAGCETRDILSSVGLKMTDIFDRALTGEVVSKSGKRIVNEYEYKNATGEVLFYKVRFEPKGFTQKRIINGAIVWGLSNGLFYETFDGSDNWSQKQREGAKTKEFEGVDPVLYNLPELLQAIKEDKEVYICEGEKDADNLQSWGITATCNFDGASKSSQKAKWKKEYSNYFKGAKVVILHDNDDSGKAHAETIASTLIGIAEYIKCPELPGLDEKGDISDWKTEGHTKGEFITLVENAELWNPILQPENVDLIKFNFSDVGNAERLLAAYGKIIRYKPGWKSWLIWSGKHWQLDHENKIESLSRKVLKKLQQQGKEIIIDSEENKKMKENIHKFVLKSEADNRIRAMINQAKSHATIIIKGMNKNVYLCNYKNGTLNMKTGKVQAHNRKDYITKLVNIDHDTAANCPNWTEFINKIFLNNVELIEYIQKSIGYSMTGNASLQCFYILHGQGSNGKGTFMKTIQTILGDYSATLKGNSLMEKMGDEGARGDLAKLEDKYFVVVNELEEGRSFDEALVKSLSSGADEVIPVRRMYEEEFDLRPTFKLWMTTNKLPKIKGTDLGIWRRVRKIPFEYSFESDIDKDERFFEDKLMPEMSGILNWAIEGCLKWQRDGMIVPAIVKYAIDDYKHDMDPVQRFIDECCIVSETCKVKRNELYDSYCEWCKENKEYTLSSIKLNRKLGEKNLEIATINGVRYWKSVGLLTRQYDDLYLSDENINPFNKI